MSSLNNIMNIASSALTAAQTQVQITSENVSNINTPGYSRKTANQEALVTGGQVNGVTISGIQNAANQYLQQASLTANAQSSAAQALSNALDQAQGLLGDPSSTSSFFSGLDNVYAALSTASDSPSLLNNQAAVTAMSSFFQQGQDVASGIQQLQTQATQQIGTDVTTINGLLQQISALNSTITQASVGANNPTGAQDQQNALITQLSGLMSVQVQANSTGGVTVRSSDGAYLAGNLGPATLAYKQSGSSSALTATPPNGTVGQNIAPGGGDIGGLIQLNDVELPQLSAQVGEYVSQAANQLNKASNASTSVPAPASLTGRQTGMALSTAISGFTGTTNIAVVNSSGVIQQQVAIDFSAGTMSVNGGAATSFTPSTFLSSLNSALGSSGTASFTNGALSISASGSGNGVSIADSTTAPSTNAGQGFSQFFGMNDVVTSSAANTNFNTGLTTADPNTFSGTITLALADSTGSTVRQANVTLPTGGTIANVLSALNSSVGAYGSFSLDSNGALTFTSNSSTPVSVSVSQDASTNSAGGPGFSQMFGIGDNATAALTGTYSVRSDIAGNANNLQSATLNLSAASGSSALLSGDGSGLLAMAQSGAATLNIPGVGGLGAASNSVTGYGSQIAGLIGNKVSSADTASTTAQATATQASSALSSATGVNLDQELVNLTTFQQAYSASARLIQAANTMYDTLLQMVP